ncbi:hypothetical protein JOC78_001387 [Bacillus ectoiniformans]|uniref:hypothetical protein n=1 Tax=Bacillus ectoiniformans TaxID=1494429 RepID=UPI001957145B|nr:hypothetical protein [Bacillus ectoiniformans]MBM7648445.1 hypothetical protein [Bacillus ectoiniformans]
MLAEIHNKISQSSSYLLDRSEDQLTGSFFGAIRYLPFELGLKQALSSAEFSQDHSNDKWRDWLDGQTGFPATWNFWHREEEGEIDLFISFNEMVIGIEVKYLSGISSEDQDITDQDQPVQSINQLARYSRMLERISGTRDAFLLFLAPYEMMVDVKKTLEGRSIISPSVELGYLCWEDIYESLRELNIDQLDRGQQFILKDLRDLLHKKGFIRFRGFALDEGIPPIMKTPYAYDYKNIDNEYSWNWHVQDIKEGQSYVYKSGY